MSLQVAVQCKGNYLCLTTCHPCFSPLQALDWQRKREMLLPTSPSHFLFCAIPLFLFQSRE